jgi:hypothetical protein
MMGYRRPVFGTVGLVAVTLGLGLILAPDLASGGPVAGLLDIVEGVGPTTVLLVTGGTLVGYLAVGLRSPRQSGTVDAFDSPDADPDAATLAGGELDETVEAAIDDGGESFQQVTATLRRTATAVYADRMECSRREARGALDRGEWCRDPLATAVLSEQRAVPFGAQVRLFVLPERERRRRIMRVLAAIERLEEP